MARPLKTVSPLGGVAKRVVAYVRMSTDHQQFSTDNQLDVIRLYATQRGMEIIRVYSDEGRSGLTMEGRESMRQLISLVVSGAADFEAILVYDVSRWGRYQDTDESAHYEYLCRKAGVAVHYCGEQFENDGSAAGSIIKTVKREMAGEYSREQSKRVFRGACRLIQLGYKQGGVAGYGLRRMLVDQTRTPKQVLARGEHKSIQTDRVILVPGPAAEVEIVRSIYHAFVSEGKREGQIAMELNARRIPNEDGPWTRGSVHGILTSEKYVGNNVYHRTSRKLKGKQVRNPPEEWVKAEGAFEAIVDREVFEAAQHVILARSHHHTNEEMLSCLRTVLDQRGRLSGLLIDETEGVPSSTAFRHRFGSLLRAYRLIGYTPEIDYRFITANRHLRKLYPELVEEMVTKIGAGGAQVERTQNAGLWTVNREFTVSLILVRCRRTEAGSLRWLLRLEAGLQPDITVAVRMDADNEQILDYYLLPAIDITAERLRLAENNGVYLDTYRFDDLDFFYELTRRTQLREAA